MGVGLQILGFVVFVLLVLGGCKWAYDHIEIKDDPKEK